MRSLRRALYLASVAGIWVSCSVNQSGLSDAGVHPDVGAGAGGSGGAVAGVAGGAAGSGRGGSVVGGSGGGATAGSAGAGGAGGEAAGAAGSGDNGGSAGSVGTGGAGDGAGVGGSGVGGTSTGAGGVGSGTGGSAGATSGVAGSNGGAGAGGSVGNGGRGGSGTGGTIAGTAGTIGGSGGITGLGGGFGGFTGNAGRGGSGAGRGGNGGRGGTIGRGGSGGNPCAGYPSGAKSFVTPTDNRVHCYWARSSSQTWSEAQQSCMLQNGHLATILSAEENDFVVSVAQFSSSFSDTWIGATDGKMGSDRTGAGTYRWVTNETWGYTSWEPGQPDGYCDPCSTGQACTCDHRVVLASDGTWNDRWQDNTRSSVCEATAN